ENEGYTPLCDAVGGCGKRRREPLRRQMRPVSWAHMATSTRFRAPSFRMRLARWALTVLGVMNSSLAISLLVRPWAEADYCHGRGEKPVAQRVSRSSAPPT